MVHSHCVEFCVDDPAKTEISLDEPTTGDLHFGRRRVDAKNPNLAT
jgi:hypothetical protein